MSSGESQLKHRFLVAVHVGAGFHSPSNEKALRLAMKRACLAASALLSHSQVLSSPYLILSQPSYFLNSYDFIRVYFLLVLIRFKCLSKNLVIMFEERSYLFLVSKSNGIYFVLFTIYMQSSEDCLTAVAAAIQVLEVSASNPHPSFRHHVIYMG